MAEVGSAYVTLLPSAKGFGSKVEKQISGGVDKAGKNTGKRFGTGFGRTFGVVGAALGVGAIIKQSSKLEQSFSKTMNLVAASTGAPQSAIAGLDKLAMQLGRDTQFSANDAAGAMLELAKAGISTSDIMGGALKGTLLLAAAGGTDLATASTIAANAMNTFNLRGKDMNSIASALAGGANASSASVESLGQALQQVGPGATNAGLSLQQTVGVLSAFDAAGIKGSDAGTSLKTMLSRLVPQTTKAANAMKKYNLSFVDSKGNFDSITTIAGKLQKQLGPLTQAQRVQALQTIFGSDATRAATVLMKQGASGLAKYIKATKDQHAAQKMANASMKGTAGAMERLRGSVETTELALGKALAPTIQKTANFLSQKALPAISKFVTGMQDGTGAGGRFAEKLGNIVDTGKSIVGFFTSLPGPVKKFGAELLIGAAVMGKLNRLIGPSISSLGQFAATLGTAEGRATSFKSKMQSLGTGLRTIAGAGGMALIADSSQRAAGRMSTLESAAGGALTGAALGAFAGPPGAAIGAAIGGLAGAALGLSRNTKSAGDKALESIGSWKSYESTLDSVTGKVTALTRQEALNRLSKSGLIQTTRSLGISDREAVTGITNEGAARTKLNGLVATSIASTKLAIQLSKVKANTGSLERRAEGKAELATAQARLKSLNALQKETGAVAKAAAARQHEIAVTRTFSAAIKSLPKAAQTEIKTKGLENTRKAVVDLTRKYDLTPKQVRTLVKEQGGKPTKKMVDSIIAAAKNLDKQHPTPKIGAKNNASPVIRTVKNELAGIRDKTVTLHIRQDGSFKTGGGNEGRAHGGPIKAGTTYLVGERGPELFTSSQAGRITPNNKLSSGAGGTMGAVGGGPVTLIVGEREMQGWFEESFDAEMSLR